MSVVFRFALIVREQLIRSSNQRHSIAGRRRRRALDFLSTTAKHDAIGRPLDRSDDVERNGPWTNLGDNLVVIAPIGLAGRFQTTLPFDRHGRCFSK